MIKLTVLDKILNFNPKKYEDEKESRLYFLSGRFFLIGGLIPLIEGFSLIGGDHNDFAVWHIFFSVSLLAFLVLREFFSIRVLVDVGFVLTAIQLYLYNVYFGIESGNYIFYIVFLIALAFFFYGTYNADFVFQLIVFSVSFTMSIFGPFYIEEASLTDAEIREMFIFNTLSGAICVFLFALFFVKLWNNSKREIEKKIVEKEVLLSEVNHRVRNNLNVIASLLKLQKEAVMGEEAKDAIHQSALRVHSMAWVHNQLYKDTEKGKINFKDYIEELVSEIQYSTGIEKEIGLKLEVDDINIDISKAIPLGQIINELITNSIKHAFGGVSDPKIEVVITQLNVGVELIYQDNGPGFNREKVSIDSLGMFLINSLSEQIDGESAIDSDGRFEYHLRVKDVSVR